MDNEADSATEFLQKEELVEEHSAEFKKELGLTDLVMTQILFIVGLPWVGVAAKQGASHTVLWLAAIVTFYIPTAMVVIYLNRQWPLEGGLYQWAKLGFNDRTGFMVAWNLWLFAILSTSEIGLQVTQYINYVMGPGGNWLTENFLVIAAANVLIIGALIAVTVIGLGVGKWVHKAGGILMLLIFATILILPLIDLGAGSIREYRPLTFELPVMSLLTLNLFGKMGFGALGGFEYVAIHAGEARDPARTIGRSVMVAAPIIAVMFVMGTSSVLSLIPKEDIDLIAPVPQVLSVGFAPLGVVAGIASTTILAIMSIRLASASVMFTGNTRLPMVAGWDDLLPAWFTRMHARYRTPVNSILFVGATTLVLSIVGMIGVGKQEAFQILWNASGVFYAITYVVMFAIPLFGMHSIGQKVPLGLKFAAASGLAMVILYICVSVIPLVTVENAFTFAAKIIGLIVVTNLVGFVIYLSAKRRRDRASHLATL